MRKILLFIMFAFAFTSIISAQDKKEIKKEEKKVVIIKTIDDNGKSTVKVLKDDEIKDGAIWIEEMGDSMKIDVNVDKIDGTKKITKTIVIPDGMKEEEFHFFNEDLLDEKNMTEGPHCKKLAFKHGIEGCHPAPRKARLGVYVEDFNGAVKVKDVIENSAAYSVGIFAGDVITEIDDKKITNTEELIREVGNHNAGDFIEIELKRNGKEKEFNVRLHGQEPDLFEMDKKMCKPFFKVEEIEKEEKH